MRPRPHAICSEWGVPRVVGPLQRVALREGGEGNAGACSRDFPPRAIGFRIGREPSARERLRALDQERRHHRCECSSTPHLSDVVLPCVLHIKQMNSEQGGVEVTLVFSRLSRFD